MGFKVRSEVRNVPISLSYQEAKEYSKIFHIFDKVLGGCRVPSVSDVQQRQKISTDIRHRCCSDLQDSDGVINVHDMKKALSEMGEKVSEEELRELIAEVDINKNYTIEEEEFLQVCVLMRKRFCVHARDVLTGGLKGGACGVNSLSHIYSTRSYPLHFLFSPPLSLPFPLLPPSSLLPCHASADECHKNRRGCKRSHGQDNPAEREGENIRGQKWRRAITLHTKSISPI